MAQIILNIGSSIGTAVHDKYVKFAQFTPYILGAIAVFLFGWILAEFVERGIVGIAKGLQLEPISKHLGIDQFLKRIHTRLSASHIVGRAVKGYLIFLFFIESTKVARLTKVAEFLTQILDYIPDLIIALFIMIVGLRVGSTLKVIIITSLRFTKSPSANALGAAIKGTVMTFAVLAALSQLQITPSLIEILFIGFVAMLALAGGLAFGLGGKDVVKEVLEAMKKASSRAAEK